VSYSAGSANASYILNIDQPKRAAAELRALFSGIQQQQAAIAKAPAGGGASSARVQSYAAEQRAIARLEAEEASLARTQGDGARAAELEARAQDRLRGALVRTDTSVAESIAIQRQLITVEQQAENAANRAAAAQAKAAKGLGTAGGLPILPRTVESFGTQAIDQFKSGLLGLVGPAALASAAIAAIPVGIELTQTGARLDATRRSFDALARSANTTGVVLLNSLREAARGTVSDAQLIESANSGILLTSGTLAKDLPRLLEIARASAQASGDDIGFVFDSLVKGIARGSPQIIDNAKITLDAAGAFETYARSIGKAPEQLNRTEQQQATLNAVLQAGTDIIAKTGGTANTNAEAFARLGTALENAKNRGASGLSESFGRYVQSGFQAVDATNQMISAITRIGEVTPEAAAATAAYDVEMQRSGDITRANAAYDAVLASGIQQVTDIEQQRIVVMQQAQALQAQSTAAQIGYANALEMSGIQQRAGAVAAQQKSDADKVAAVDAQTHGIAEEKLAKQAQFAAEALLRAGPAGARTAALLANSSQQIDVLTAAFYRLAAAKAVSAVSNPLDGITEDRSERQGAKGNADARAAIAQQQAATEQARLQQLIQTGSAAQKAAALQTAYNNAVKQFGKDSKEAVNAQTAIIAAQQAAEKTGGKARVSAAQSTALQLQNTEQDSQLQLLRTQREGLERLRDQQEDYDVRRTRSKEDEDRKIKGLLARGQIAEANRERENFAREQQRAAEDFDRERRRTNRNNAEGVGDIGARTDLKQEQIGARAALRGGTASLGGGTAPASLGGAQQATGGEGRIISITFPSAIFAPDGQKLGDIVYPFVSQRLDDDIAIEIRSAPTLGGNQTAVAGTRP
jgi:hypothetical protein